MKKKNVLVIILVGIVILVGAIYFLEGNNKGVYSEFEHITTKQIFLKNSMDEKNEYYVYFYRKDCPDCTKIKDNISDFAKKYDVYFINTRDNNPDTKIISFDWSKFKTENDIEIGKINSENKVEYYEGESEEKYLQNTEMNRFKKIKKYEIVTADDKYLEVNKNAKKGFVYASLLTPEIDYTKVGINSSIELSGVPTLLKINGYSIENYYYDSKDIVSYINSLK